MPVHAARLLSITCVIIFLYACTTLPDKPESATSAASQAPGAGHLAALQASLTPALSAGESAFHLLPKAHKALAARLALIDKAEHSIDVQYFVWHGDAVGTLLLERLYAAAERGVTVRLLVDDLHLVSANAYGNSDPMLATVSFHPNLEFRLFNPGKYRDGTVGAVNSMASDSLHYNRRMHNKLLLVDGRFAILGGRNIGDEYFGLSEEFNFIDLEVVVTGAVIEQVAETFVQYWNADMVYPAEALHDVEATDFDQMREENQAFLEENASLLATFAGLDPDGLLEDIVASMYRGKASFYADDPRERSLGESRLYQLINEAIAPGTSEILASTPYLIPADKLLTYFEGDEKLGVDVRLLTNSLATNNQPAVHAHYEKYRKVFLDMGVELYELHHQPVGRLREYVDSPPAESEFIALHMKASVYDTDRCFIGTLNLDPRSIDINTEDVLYIEAPRLCNELHDFLEFIVQPDSAWEVSRDAEGDLQWRSYEGTVSQQPARSASQRLLDPLYRLLPEGQM